MRRREGDVAFGIALGELRLVQPVDGAAGDEFDRRRRFPAVNFLATVSATRSRQLPPQMLTTSLSCACAGTAIGRAKQHETKGEA